jgi:hypothetical protein
MLEIMREMRVKWWCVALFLLLTGLAAGQLLSEAGPTFRFTDNQLPSPQAFIAYGDQRFTDPANVTATDPRVRKRSS